MFLAVNQTLLLPLEARPTA